MNSSRRRILWVDCLAGGFVGAAMLVGHRPLAELYQLPAAWVLMIAATNLGYAAFSSRLARSASVPRVSFHVLAAANCVWGAICLGLAVASSSFASALGTVHLVAEGLFVGMLGVVEWRWRRDIVSPTGSSEMGS